MNQSELAAEDARRDALLGSVPEFDEETPLAAQLAMDTRRQISLTAQQFPRPRQTRVLTVANQKGGVGKTTTAVNIAASLARAGLNVLVIDNDPQGNASTALGVEHASGTPSIYDVLLGESSLGEIVQPSTYSDRLLVAPATIDLSGAEIELVSLVSRETRLRTAVRDYLIARSAQGEVRLDYVFIDCPPSLGLLTVNAFTAASEVLIPIQCEYYALRASVSFCETSNSFAAISIPR